ncbi:hypothetical protein [Burkholderia stagnalis]|uniref:DUF7674 family protein n=1 Tax=Burkholderia stagnalis TaxID=1503054 RepID=UPI0012D8C51C|nr:hypothetical protein [Burkholderia stagnalis]
MMREWNEFFLCLERIELIREAREEAILDWGGDIPVTLLFSIVGKCIAKRFDAFSEEDRSYIFEIIEIGMVEGSDRLREGIATGLLEAMYGEASKYPSVAQRIDSLIGKKSRGYLIELERWHRS